jgi:hypothetical protein
MGREMRTKFWSENRKWRDHFEDLGVELQSVAGQRLVVSFCENGNEPSDPIKGRERIE